MKQIKLTNETAERLATEIEAKRRDVEDFVNTAVMRKFSREAFEIDEIRKGLAESEPGELASEKEVAAVLSRYATDEEDQVDPSGALSTGQHRRLHRSALA